MMRSLMNRPVLLSVVATLIGFVIIVVVLPMRYETNDDVVLKNSLSGDDGFLPDASSTTHCISQTLSSVMYRLYQFSPTVPWFQIMLYLAAFAGIVLSVSVLVRTALERHSILSALVILPPIASWIVYVFSKVSFTSAALVLEFGVFLSVLDWVRQEQASSGHERRMALFLSFCLIVSYLIRWSLTLYFVGFLFPVLLFMKRDHLKPLVIMLVIFLVFVSADRIAFTLTASQQQEEFMEFNKVRSSFHDTVAGDFWGERTAIAAQEVGWHLDDYWFFKSWIVYDDRLFNTERVQAFLRENYDRSVRFLSRVLWTQLENSVKISRTHLLIFALAILALLLINGQGLRRLSLAGKMKIVTVMGFTGAGILLLMCYRFPFRISIPLLFYALGIAFVILSKGESHNDRKMIIVTGICMLAITWQVFTQAVQHYRSLESSAQENRYVLQCLQRIRVSQEHKSIIIQMVPALRNGMGFENIHPLKRSSDFTTFEGVFSNPVNSPRYYSYLNSLGLKDGHDFMKWAINNPRVLLAFFDRGNSVLSMAIPLWESYYRRNLTMGSPVQLQKAYDFRNRESVGLVFFRLVTS